MGIVLSAYDAVYKPTGYFAGAKGYILGFFDSSIANGRRPDALVYWHKILGNGENWRLCREFVDFLSPIGKNEVVIYWRPDDYTLEMMLNKPSMPPVVILPDDGGDDTGDNGGNEQNEEEPPMTVQTYLITEYERHTDKNTPVLVGHWVRNDDKITLIYPSGRIVESVTGNKPEYNFNSVGGYEVEYIREVGEYHVQIADSPIFSFTTDGRQWIKLGWREGQVVEGMVRLVSNPMSRIEAEGILSILNSEDETKDLFSIKAETK